MQKNYSETLKRTVIVQSECLPREVANIFKEIEAIYRSMLEEIIDYALRNNVRSRKKLHQAFYKRFREKYPNLPSHYIHGAILDALTRVKSFLQLKKKGKAYTNKPIIRKVSIHLDSIIHNWDIKEITISTPKDKVRIPLKIHKHYMRYVMNGWKKTDIIRMKVNDDKLAFYITFRKECHIIDRPSAIVIDLNENNATIGVYSKRGIKIIRYEHKLGDIVKRYHYKRKFIQMRYGIHRKGVTPNLNLMFRGAMQKIKGRERRKKRDIIYKMCKYIINLAKEHNANIYVGKVNKDSIVCSVKNNKLRHRLYQWSVKTIIGTLIDKGLESGVRVVTVNEAYTSSTCPICGSRLNKNSSPMTHYVVRRGVMNALKVKVLKFGFRFLKCPKCGFKHDRDVIAVLNMFKRIRKWVPSTLGTTAQTLIWGCGNPELIITKQIITNKDK